MNTKEAIKLCGTIYTIEREIDTGGLLPNYKLMDAMPKIIELLQRGEKYEIVFKKFVRFIFSWRYPISHKVMREKVRELRRKYFPKGDK